MLENGLLVLQIVTMGWVMFRIVQATLGGKNPGPRSPAGDT
jgi:hypothetical protein